MRKDGADGSFGGVVSNPPGDGIVASEARVSTVEGEGVEDRRVPVIVEVEADLEAITSSSCTFFHNAWRVKGIIPSILHHVMLCSLLKSISRAGLNHFMK